MTEWTVSTLKEHYDALLSERKESQQQAIDAAFEAAKELNAQALQAANERFAAFVAATDKRFESVNEFRGTLADNQATYLPRDEYNAGRRNEIGDKAQAGTSVRGVIAIGLTALGLVITLVVIAANAFFGNQ